QRHQFFELLAHFRRDDRRLAERGAAVNDAMAHGHRRRGPRLGTERPEEQGQRLLVVARPTAVRPALLQKGFALLRRGQSTRVRADAGHLTHHQPLRTVLADWGEHRRLDAGGAGVENKDRAHHQKVSQCALAKQLDRKLGNQQYGIMKTTLDLPDALMKQVKLRAVHDGRKLKDTVADLLRKGLAVAAPSDDNSVEPTITKDK